VDTGFNGVLAIDRDIAQREGLLDRVRIKPSLLDSVVFKSLTVGQLTIDISEAPTLLTHLGTLREVGGIEIAGIIGFGLLKAYVTRIDYVRGKLILQFNKSADERRVLIFDGQGKLVEIIPVIPRIDPLAIRLPQQGRIELSQPVGVPLNRDKLEQRGLPFVRAKVNEICEVEFLVDTGATTTSIPASLARKIGFSHKVQGIKSVVGDGRVIEESAVRLRSLMVGEKRLEQMVAYFNEDPPPQKSLSVTALPPELGRIGGNFLKHFEVTIDGPNAVVYLEGPYPDLPDVWNEATTGMRLQLRNGQWFVAVVLRPSPASEAGVQVGDELIEIDGKSIQSLSAEDVQGSLIGPGNSSVRLTIQRNGDRKCFEVRRRRLL
jgi:predicted aspartyl protease